MKILTDEQAKLVCVDCPAQKERYLGCDGFVAGQYCPKHLQAQAELTAGEILEAIESQFQVDATDGGKLKDYTGYHGIVVASKKQWDEFKAKLTGGE